MSTLENRNVIVLTPHGVFRSSMRLEPEMWEAIREICLRENTTMRDWMARVVDNMAAHQTRTSAVRVAVLQYFRDKVNRNDPLSIGAPVDAAVRRDVSNALRALSAQEG